jgi:hypothetical protein
MMTLGSNRTSRGGGGSKAPTERNTTGQASWDPSFSEGVHGVSLAKANPVALLLPPLPRYHGENMTLPW